MPRTQLRSQCKATPEGFQGTFQPGLLLQRKCDCGNHAMNGSCDDCAKKKSLLQRKSAHRIESSEAPSIVHEVLRSTGQPLDIVTRAFMEPRFGRDFSNVRVHTGAKAAESARSVSALAFTVGQDIVLGDGANAANAWERQKTLAHELTHVIQQSQSSRLSRLPLTIGNEDDHAEREADRTADRVMANQSVATSGLGATPEGVNVIQRTPSSGCSAKVTGVKDPDSLVDAARRDATTRVKTALAQAKAPSSRTLRQFDRHFHCPEASQIVEATHTLTRIGAMLPTLQTSCVGRSTPGCTGETLGHGNGQALELCPSFFNTGDDSRTAFLIAAAAKIDGRPMTCLQDEACYDEFTKPASVMLTNAYSYAYFAFDASGSSRVSQPSILPCRPIETGENVIVPADAATNPSGIRRLTGRDPIPPGAQIVSVYSDRSGKYFIYRSLPGSQVYMPGEGERYYLPGGRP